MASKFRSATASRSIATLDVGRIEETVSVTAESPLLETRSGSAGQVIGEKQISLMPLSDGNPFALTRLVPGVAYNGDLKFSRPFDNGGTSSINADGSTGGNEFTLDGSPNMANGRRVAFVPPAGAVSEFKVVDGELRRVGRAHGRRDGERDAEERHEPGEGGGLRIHAARPGSRRPTSSSRRAARRNPRSPTIGPASRSADLW